VTAKSPWLASETEKRQRKICDSLEEAIRRSGLQNGMTSLPPRFRGGDKVVNMVVAKLAEMGFRDLTLASSSLIDAHWPLIEHIKNGVIRQIYTSGSAR
jgi:citrate lyase subunit alpha/citrate CoA-transferase